MESPFTNYVGNENGSNTSPFKYEREIEQRSPFVKFIEPETAYAIQTIRTKADQFNDEDELEDVSHEQEDVFHEAALSTEEELEKNWNEENFYTIYDREEDLKQHGFSVVNELFEGELTEKQLKDAKDFNEKNAKALKWDGRLNEICGLIGVNPITDLSGMNDDFLQAVARWQQSGSDGKIGKDTWKKMQLLHNLRKVPTVRTESKPAEKTFFVPLEHGGENGTTPQTAIFVPQGTSKTNTSISILLYLHGFKDASGSGLKSNSTIEDFLNTKTYDLRGTINSSDKSVILVAPTMGNESQAGMIAEHPDFFDKYIDCVLWVLQNEFYDMKPVTVNNIVLSAHSGGGQPMLNILRMNSSKYNPKIVECWGFDSLYQLSVKDFSAYSWKKWLTDNTSKTFYNYSVSQAKRDKDCGKLKDPPTPWVNSGDTDLNRLPNYKPENSVVCHLDVPLHYLKVRLASSSPFSKR